ncbi:hypothetical protein CLAIMM_07552 [Cladophialophora immunda]|nr:hypothetical protein CLAIMM_07552 [Cladophialophora immunda]
MLLFDALGTHGLRGTERARMLGGYLGPLEDYPGSSSDTIVEWTSKAAAWTRATQCKEEPGVWTPRFHQAFSHTVELCHRVIVGLTIERGILALLTAQTC